MTEETHQGAPPMFQFEGRVSGYKIELPDDRTVEVAIGRTTNGETHWGLTFTNKGHKLIFGLSDEAMDAVAYLYATLVQRKNDQPTWTVEVPHG